MSSMDSRRHSSDAVRIIGRSSSLFTRVPLIFAEELGIRYELVPIYDMTAMDPQAYGGSPALKLPSLRRGESLLFGAQNICRALAEISASPLRIVWPEDLRDDMSRNAQELVWHAMGAQVQLVFGTIIGKLPADNVYFAKGRAGFESSLRWLDRHAAQILGTLPPRDISLFEVSLFCLMEHLAFRGTLPVEPYPSLVRFSQEFAARPSAQHTVYRFDASAAE
ncbi:MAG: glutathione S-transferase family protein [Steroidobacteraceae bacterium]